MEPDYKAMYFSLMRKIENAINILVQAQRDGEQAYIDAGEHGEPLHILPFPQNSTPPDEK